MTGAPRGLEALQGVVVAVAAAGLVVGASTALRSGVAPILGLALGLIIATQGPRRAVGIDEKTWHRVGLIALAVFSLTSVAWALAFDSQQGSDFGVYWRCGIAADEHRASACQSAYVAPTSLYWARALLTSRVWGVMFGDAPRGFDAFNAALHVLSLSLLYVTVRRRWSAAAGTVAVVVWGLFPERVFSLTLATPDHIASVLTVVLLAVDQHAEEASAPHRWLSPLVTGTLLAGLELARNTGLMFGAALVLVAVASWSPRRVGQAVLAVILCSLLVRATLSAWPITDDASYGLAKAAAVDLTSEQGFAPTLRWANHLLPATPTDERTSVALGALRTELAAHFGLYPSYLATKGAQLFAGSGYQQFASADLSANPDTVLTVPFSTVPASPAWVLRALMAVLVGAALVATLRSRALTLPVAMFAVFIATVLLLNEAQARYLFVVGPALAATVGSAFDPRREQTPGGPMLARGLAALVAIVLAVAAWASWSSRATLGLEGARLKADLECSGATLTTTLQRARLELPAGVTCARVTVPHRRAGRLRGYVTQGAFPFPFEQRTDAAVDWVMTSSGGVLASGHLAEQTVDYFNGLADGDATLEVRRTGAATSAVAVELAHVQAY
ncbi:MAG: hypothetical protein Q8S33_01630 [Myxococcales bacterium]|nr:hypothetical protein [Myxococcales bacterium]